VIGKGSPKDVAATAVVLAHNVWSGGALAVVVTLFGRAALIKGLALLMVPPRVMASTYRAAGYEKYFYVWMSALLVLGLWITLDAFAS
jgi:hypothetical protein